MSTAFETFQASLPIGVATADGTILKDVVLKQPSGRMRRDLAKEPNATDALIQALSHCVAKLGSIIDPGRELLLQLVEEDLHYLSLLLFAELHASPKIEISIQCGTCGDPIETFVDVASIGVMEIEDALEPEVTYEGAFISGRAEIGSDIVELKVKLRSLRDLKEIQGKVRREDPSEMELLYLMLLSQVHTIDGKSLTMDELYDLPIAEFDSVAPAVAEMLEKVNGIDKEIIVGCDSCQAHNSTVLDRDAWLRPILPRRLK